MKNVNDVIAALPQDQQEKIHARATELLRERQQTVIIAGCSVCLGVFSSQSEFDSHICEDVTSGVQAALRQDREEFCAMTEDEQSAYTKTNKTPGGCYTIPIHSTPEDEEKRCVWCNSPLRGEDDDLVQLCCWECNKKMMGLE